MALIVRTDLDMSRGKIVAQAAHAAVEVALKARGTAMFERWRQAGSRKISLIGPNLETIDDISSKCAHGIVSHVVKDAGHTEPSRFRHIQGAPCCIEHDRHPELHL